jgi:hypothetical protein
LKPESGDSWRVHLTLKSCHLITLIVTCPPAHDAARLAITKIAQSEPSLTYHLNINWWPIISFYLQVYCNCISPPW